MPDAMTLISKTTIISQAYSAVFSSVPQNFRDLHLVVTGTASGSSNMTIYFNSDFAGANCPAIYLNGDGGTASSGSLNNYVGGIYGSNLTTNTISIFDYSQTDKHKTYLSRLAAPSGATSLIAGRWTNTAAINTVQLGLGGSAFLAGTTISLFGVVG